MAKLLQNRVALPQFLCDTHRMHILPRLTVRFFTMAFFKKRTSRTKAENGAKGAAARWPKRSLPSLPDDVLIFMLFSLTNMDLCAVAAVSTALRTTAHPVMKLRRAQAMRAMWLTANPEYGLIGCVVEYNVRDHLRGKRRRDDAHVSHVVKATCVSFSSHRGAMGGNGTLKLVAHDDHEDRYVYVAGKLSVWRLVCLCEVRDRPEKLAECPCCDVKRQSGLRHPAFRFFGEFQHGVAVETAEVESNRRRVKC